MSNFLTAIAHFFQNLFGALFGKALSQQLQDTLVAFAKDAVGKLAIDAVAWVQAEMPGEDALAKREAAKAKLIADLKQTGKDAEALGEAVLNFTVEMAVQYLKAHLGAIGSLPTTSTATPESPAASTAQESNKK